MRKPETCRGRAAWCAALVFALAACAVWAAGAAAQSGRKSRPSYPQPKPQTEATPEQGESGGESESESRPRAADQKDSALATFIVMESDNEVFSADPITRRDVVESFAKRLGSSPSIAVSSGGRGTRSDARRRAQSERTAYVVLVSLEADNGSGEVIRRPGQEENRTLVVRTAVFEPKTGTIKYTDTIFQRPVRDTVSVGGVRLPIPTRTRTVTRYPSERELRQAAHEAADRLLSRFLQITPPPEQP